MKNNLKNKEEENVVESVKKEQIKEEKPKKKNKNIGKIILNTITIIIVLVVIFEAAIGIVNMQKIQNEEEPVWYISTKTTETDLKTVTEYNLGLYKIVKTDTAKQTKTTLKPFFLGE